MNQTHVINSLKCFFFIFVSAEIFAKYVTPPRLKLRLVGICAGFHCAESENLIFEKIVLVPIFRESGVHMLIFCKKNFEYFSKIQN